MRNFRIAEQFEDIKKSAIEAIQSIFPVEGKRRLLTLENVWVDDKLSPTDFQGQSKTKSRNGTWGTPVYASLVLKDKATGEILDREAKIRLFTLPKATDRFSYIVKGSEYQVYNQLRLKPGAYTLRKQNGELKTMINLAGKSFDLVFNEKSGQFLISKVGGGQANIPLYPILIHLGISQSAIAKRWGDTLAAANRNTDPKVIERALVAFNVTDLKEHFKTTKMNAEVNKNTLGKAYTSVNGMMLLDSAKKLLDVHLGKKEPEDRDSLSYKELHSLEDFIKERLEKNKRTLGWKIARNIDNLKRTKVSQIVNPGAFSSVIEDFFTQDDKSTSPEQTNPLDMVSGQYKATIMGSGGIKSHHAITNEMREIHPSHYGFIDPIHTPESDKIGASLHIPIGAIKDGKELKTTVIDSKGEVFYLTPSQAYEATIAFPGEKGTKVKAIHKGKAVVVNRSQVDYFTPSHNAIFSWSTNLIPFLASTQGNRAMMAAKMMEQAISLKSREAPYVQIKAGKSSLEKQIGNTLVVTALEDGTVSSISPDKITVRGRSGTKEYNLYNNFTLNRKAFMNHNSKVSKGDKVKKGQMLAESNFTRDGVLALGTNLRTAYLPYKGLGFEDGIVITEAASDKLTSEHIYKKTLDLDSDTILNITTFRTQYPNTLTPENMAKLDKDGVIKRGQRVEMGDAIIVGLRKRTPSSAIGIIQRQLADRPKDVSVYWNLEDTGIVTRIEKSAGAINVYIKTEEAAKVGDKLSGRYGNKGVITKIISEGETPKNKDGEPVEIMLNPHGIISRINLGQIYESALGKVSKSKNKPYLVQNFSGEDHREEVNRVLKEAGIDDKEELFDPETGKSIGRVHVGNPYILKLYKQTASNFSARQGGPGHPYDMNQQPLKTGGEDGSKNLDLLTFYSMLAHGARANLREMSTIKSDRNDEYWKALKSGQSLPPPKSPFVYDKFLGYLKGAGIDVKKNGTKTVLAPMTDEEVLKASAGEVKKPIFYRSKDMEPLKDGFFDPIKFGGFKGTKWGHISLKEAVINPVFETAVRKITGLGTKFDQIMAGKLHVDKDGQLNDKGEGLTGGVGIERILKKINVDSEIDKLTTTIKKLKGTSLDNANKKLRYLMALKQHGLTPDKAYMRRQVPVVPPIYRSLYPLPDGSVTTSDLNFLYQNVGVLNEMSKLPVMDLLPDDEKADLRKDIYYHVKGLSGLTDINIKGRIRKGFISEIKGDQPKKGLFLNKVISKRQDFVGRGTIIPDPQLSVDEMGMPEQMAWKIFEPFVIKELRKFGKTPNQAMDEIDKKSDLAKKALEVVMNERPVLLNRAPSLHKFSIMAFKPKITEGKSIKIPPLVVKGFNADFDGDTMTVHTPIGQEAVIEAQTMFPSKNLYQPGTGRLMMMPSQEAQIGIFYLSKTTTGRKKLNKILGKKFSVTAVLDKKETVKLLTRISKESPHSFGSIITKLKMLGENHAYTTGFTLGMEDLSVPKTDRDRIITGIKKMITPNTSPEKLSLINKKATDLVNKILERRFKNKNNPLYDMVESGARGDPSQLRSILATPLFMSDSRGRIIPTPISKSYSEGLDIGDYWTSMYGARRGMMDRALSTSQPGVFAKNIMASVVDQVISDIDCGTRRGIELSIKDPDILDRYLAIAQHGFSRNTLVDQRAMSKMKRAGAKTVLVRSPLNCLQAKGVCAKCYGLDENGQLPEIGDNVGAKAGQTMSEPLIQLVMNCSEGNIIDSSGNVSSFLDFYESLKTDESFDGKCYTKHGGFDSITDRGKIVHSGLIQHHEADDVLFFMKTKTGHSLLVQGNHPLWVYDSEGNEKEVLCRDVETGDRLHVDTSMLEGNEDAPFDPYWIGLFLAEGCTRYGNGTEKYENVAVASILSQCNNEIKDKAFLKVAHVKGATKHDKDIQVYNPSWAKEMAQIVRGRKAKLKRLCPGFNKWKVEDLEALLGGWIDGDGTVFNKNGTTVAQIYTSSYVALQQLEIICNKLEIRYTPLVVPKRPLQKTVQFLAQLRFKNEGVYQHSVKMQQLDFFITDYKIKNEEYEPIIYIKELWEWDLPVWDIKTESRGFTCGMVRNHNTFHTGGVAGTGADVTGYKRIDQLLAMPKTVSGSTTLAPVTGIVKSITPGIAGGYDITIDTKKVHVSQGLKLKIKKGSRVRVGDPLSDGVIRPQDLVRYKGMEAAQRYMADELQNAYASQKVDIQKKIFETVVRGVGNTTKVLNNPDTASYIPGDIIPYTVAQHHNNNLTAALPIDETVGLKLAKNYGPIRKGKRLLQKDIVLLKALGHKELLVTREAIIHEPTLRNVTTLPILKRNWMSALGYRNLAKALTEGAGQAWETDFEDYHPIPAFAFGEQFGKGRKGKY